MQTPILVPTPSGTDLEIALIDSGSGSLTVACPLHRIAPGLGLRIINDNRGHPYGAKSDREVAASIVAALRPHASAVAAVVVACHSGSRPPVLTRVREEFGFPTFGMLDSWVMQTARACLRFDRPPRVALMGTELTIRMGVHARRLREAVAARGDRLESVVPVACPNLATLIDRDGVNLSSELREEIRACLQPYLGKLDLIGLICTHYGLPDVRKTIRTLTGPSVVLSDAGSAVARRVAVWAGQMLPAHPPSARVRATLFNTHPDRAGALRTADLWLQLTGAPLDADELRQAAV